MGRPSDAKKRLMEAVVELLWTASYGSTTIDHICEKAGVKKGSFYYFYDSKASLAVAALDDAWLHHRVELDAIFSPTIPPLERFRKYCDYNYKIQAEMKAKFGHVLGCPMFCLGCEISTQEDHLQKKVNEMLDQKRKYLESAIRDAHAAGLIDVPDAAAKARTLFSFYQGQLTEARIQNKLEIARGAFAGTCELLGIKPDKAMAA
jgi:TetR/AcrR family transcriptional repressor of nem operon